MNWLSCHLYKKIVRIRLKIPLISFTFDDFPRSALRAARILKEHGCRGTFYISLGLMGKYGELGEFFHAKDIKNLVDDGHELGGHTFSHLDCLETSPEEYRKDVHKNINGIYRELEGYIVRNFSFPWGHVSPGCKKTISRYFRSMRGTQGGGINAGMVDLNLLRTNSLYNRTNTISEIRDLIRVNLEEGGWLIFYTHDIRENPSPFGCTPGFFQSVLNATLASPSQILTVNQVLELLLSEAPNKPNKPNLKIKSAPTGFDTKYLGMSKE